ncbi:MAG: CrcB family protein [Acidimicrobiia bacterium]|nr:CrcB family protein [Acidimicrobiia bacterium]
MSAVLLISVGGCIGALIRWVLTIVDRRIPWMMMAANITASGAAGWLSELDGSWRWLINAGLLGALSTWSSLAVAAIRLGREEGLAVAAGVLIGTTTGSVAAAWFLLQFH